MSQKFNPIRRRSFLKALGSAGLAASAWGLRLIPELGGARSGLAAAATSAAATEHPLSAFKPVSHGEPTGAALHSATRAILGGDDVRQVAASAGFDPDRLTPGKISHEIDADGVTLTVGTWVIDDTHALIYASVDRRLEWFKSLSMVVTTDAKVGQVIAHTLNGRTPTRVKPADEPSGGALSAALGVTEAQAGYYGFCCGAYYNCCYDRWGNWQRYWHWTGKSPCGIDWTCAADVCGAPCFVACATGVGCIPCILLLCGYAAIRCTRWCDTCYYCYET